MEKYYCKVEFSFGTYTFHTMLCGLLRGDNVLCKMRDYYQVGRFAGYCERPKFETKPCYGGIDHIVQNHEEMEEQYRKQHEKYCPAFEYAVGDEFLRAGSIWRMEKDRCFHFVRLA